MKELRNEMVVTLKYINKRFGNSVLVTVTSNFICLTVAVFWVMTKFVYAGKIFLLGETRKKYTFVFFFINFFLFSRVMSPCYSTSFEFFLCFQFGRRVYSGSTYSTLIVCGIILKTIISIAG
jgi:hypothetical protein